MVYRFGEFTLDDSTRQLISNGSELHLSTKAFELLTFLLTSRPRVVSKNELQERLWPTTFVQETNIAGLVAEIRRALGDPPSNPRFIRTVHRVGYRFTGDVIEETTVSRAPSVQSRLYLVLDQREIMLMEGANVVGRAPEATIRIDSPGISRLHARILVHDGAATLEDLGSKNGTHVNGARIAAPHTLCDGHEIRLGTIVLTFRVAPAITATETVHH